MPPASVEPFLKGDTGRNTRGLLRLVILLTIAAAAVASRLFSVIRTRTLISHELTGRIYLVVSPQLTVLDPRFRKYHSRVFVSLQPTLEQQYCKTCLPKNISEAE